MQNYEDLIVWQKAHALAVRIKEVTERWPRDSSGIVGQMRRAAVSIASNIAEGCNRPTDRDFAKFLQIAIASSGELQYQLQYARDTRLLPRTEAVELLERVTEVRRMLHGLLHAVQRRNPQAQPKTDRSG